MSQPIYDRNFHKLANESVVRHISSFHTEHNSTFLFSTLCSLRILTSNFSASYLALETQTTMKDHPDMSNDGHQPLHYHYHNRHDEQQQPEQKPPTASNTPASSAVCHRFMLRTCISQWTSHVKQRKAFRKKLRLAIRYWRISLGIRKRKRMGAMHLDEDVRAAKRRRYE